MRLEGIDILRGFAVTVVVLHHFFEILGLHEYTFYPYASTLGQLGVPLFFVISGYLIYQSIDYSISTKGTKGGLKHYTLHRLFRILPAYYFNFFIIFILALYFLNTMDTWSDKFIGKQIFSHLTFTSYFIYKISGLGINGAYWTLSIEMLWYIMAPLLFIFIKKDRYLILLFCMSLLYLVSLDLSLLDPLLQLNHSASNYINLLFYWSFQLPGQLIYFLAGIFIYKYSKKNISLSRFVQYSVVPLSIYLFIYLSSQKYFLESLTFRNLITLLIVTLLFMVLYRYKRTELHLLAWIGKISYSLYLWHMPLLFIFKRYITLSDISLWSVASIYLVLLFTISALSYYLIEEGGFYLRKRLEQKIAKISVP